MASIGRWVTASCIQLGQPARAAAPLLKAVRKVQPSAVYLTPLHVSFLQVCVMAKLYQQATDLLADDVCEVRPREYHSTTRTVRVASADATHKRSPSRASAESRRRNSKPPCAESASALRS